MKIIHVDTNQYALAEMRKELSHLAPEAEVHCFNHPDHALAFAVAHGCDVLLTEIELWAERLGGVRLAEAMKKINPRVHVIFVTVCNENEIAGELSGLPISGFLPKPWRMENLAEIFANLRYAL